MSDPAFERPRRIVEGHRGHGPRGHRGRDGTVSIVEVHCAGEEIELADAGRTRWRAGEGEPSFAAEVGVSRPARRTLFGLEVAVMRLEDRVRCMRRIGRPVNVENLARIAADG